MTPDPDVPRALVADVRYRLDHNYCIFQPQIREMLEAFDHLEHKHRADLRAIATLQEKLRELQRLDSSPVAGASPDCAVGYDTVSGVVVSTPAARIKNKISAARRPLCPR